MGIDRCDKRNGGLFTRYQVRRLILQVHWLPKSVGPRYWLCRQDCWFRFFVGMTDPHDLHAPSPKFRRHFWLRIHLPPHCPCDGETKSWTFWNVGLPHHNERPRDVSGHPIKMEHPPTHLSAGSGKMLCSHWLPAANPKRIKCISLAMGGFEMK